MVIRLANEAREPGRARRRFPVFRSGQSGEGAGKIDDIWQLGIWTEELAALELRQQFLGVTHLRSIVRVDSGNIRGRAPPWAPKR